MSWAFSDLGLLLMHTRLFTNKLKKDKEKLIFFYKNFYLGKQMGKYKFTIFIGWLYLN